MPRPRKKRRIRGSPSSAYFKPAGIPIISLQEINLTKEEFESIRLIDYKKIPQTRAAEMLGISQPSLSRALTRAREKISDAIVNGKAIKIEKD